MKNNTNLYMKKIETNHSVTTKEMNGHKQRRRKSAQHPYEGKAHNLKAD